MRKTSDINFTGIDIFCGAGGMGLGAEWAGIDIKVAVEIDSYCAQTYKLYHTAKIITEDIRKIKPKEFISYQPFVIFGGPPCQGFSSSNTRTRTSDNPRNWMYKEFIRFIKELHPIWFVFENVPGFKNFDGGNLRRELELKLAGLGYDAIYSDVLNAVNFGVPQIRNRFFMVGNCLGINFVVPAQKSEPVTVADALADLPKLRNGEKYEELPYEEVEELSSYAQLMRQNSQSSKQNFVSRNKDYIIERYHHIKPGQNWKAIPRELMNNYKNLAACHSGIYRRLHPNEPSVVIANFRKNMLIHPYEHRGLSIREAARLQSFPDDRLFEGPLGSIQQQIGNAVPPLLAKKIFEQILNLTDK